MELVPLTKADAETCGDRNPTDAWSGYIWCSPPREEQCAREAVCKVAVCKAYEPCQTIIRLSPQSVTLGFIEFSVISILVLLMFSLLFIMNMVTFTQRVLLAPLAS